MTKLSDTQAILLTTAAARENGMLLPVPDTITAPAVAVRKSIASLAARGFAAEVDVAQQSLAWRSEGESHVGAVITDAGRAAIGLVDGGENSSPPPAEPPSPKRETKAGMVLALLQRESGATLAELVTATGWLPHTTRAALTGIKKKGHSIAKSKRDEVTCYHIGTAA